MHELDERLVGGYHDVAVLAVDAANRPLHALARTRQHAPPRQVRPGGDVDLQMGQQQAVDVCVVGASLHALDGQRDGDALARSHRPRSVDDGDEAHLRRSPAVLVAQEPRRLREALDRLALLLLLLLLHQVAALPRLHVQRELARPWRSIGSPFSGKRHHLARLHRRPVEPVLLQHQLRLHRVLDHARAVLRRRLERVRQHMRISTEVLPVWPLVLGLRAAWERELEVPRVRVGRERAGPLHHRFLAHEQRHRLDVEALVVRSRMRPVPHVVGPRDSRLADAA